MAKFKSNMAVTVETQMTITEQELTALYDIFIGYGIDGFITSFYKYFGEAYLKKNESSLRSFVASLAEAHAAVIPRANLMRSALIPGNKVVKSTAA